MLERENNSTEHKEISTQENTSSKARRNFLKKAAIGAPIVIASSTKPAWGAACMSGIMSGNVSNHTHTCELQGGLSHGHWKNHYIGSMNNHWTSGQKPAQQWWKKQSEIKESLRAKFKFFYVQLANDSYVYSTFKRNSQLDGKNFGWLLINGTEYQREIVTAFINASVPSVNYPYSLSDVQEIYDLVKLGDADADAVAHMLEGIHS